MSLIKKKRKTENAQQLNQDGWKITLTGSCTVLTFKLNKHTHFFYYSIFKAWKFDPRSFSRFKKRVGPRRIYNIYLFLINIID